MVPTPTIEPTQTPQPTMVPTATPRPTPTPLYRAEGRPKTLGHDGFTFTDGPFANGDEIWFTARLEMGRYPDPTEIQVYQALTKEETTECNTEKPVAFITKPIGSGSTYIAATSPRTWLYCTSSSARPIQYSDDIPWLAATQWNISNTKRRRTTDPYITTWTVRIDLGDERVDELRYNRPEGWIIVAFEGEKLLARQWIDY